MPVGVNAQVNSSVTALEREFNAIAHNLANVNTAGYKRITTAFSKELEKQRGRYGKNDSSKAEANQHLDFTQGHSLIETGRSLDVALFGKGFFVVESPDGLVYTRHGSFKLNQNGQMVDSAGRIVSGQAGPISIPTDTPASQITIGVDGTVGVPGQTFGKLKVVDFPDNEAKIIPAGSGVFAVPEDVKPTESESYSLRQGSLESSNVRIVDELVNMITVSRLYEANMKFMTVKKDASRNLMSVAMG